MNKGFRAARGEFLGWTISDDTCLSGAFRGAVDYPDAHPEEAMVYGEGCNVAECFILQPTVFLRIRGLLDIDRTAISR
ncbi:MAG: hypothetical protein HZB91_06675 [Elusimicrobia bacterium]|nr:hypothetical protein [Elusimicrobiota bacterium]